MAAEGSQRVDICEGCETPEVTHICENCPVNLCSRCAHSHTRLKATSSHKLRELGLAYSETPSSSETVLTYCLVHPDNQLTSYCNTCEDMLCTHCERSSHRNHSLTPINQSKAKMQRLCMVFLSKLFNTATTLKAADKDAGTLKDEYITGLQKMKSDLFNRKQNLLEYIESSYENSVSEVDAEIARVSHAYNNFDTFMSQRTESLIQAEQLDTKLVSVRRQDDINHLIDALRECKTVYPKIQKMAASTESELISVKPEKMLAPDDEPGKAKLLIKKALSIIRQQNNKPDIRNTVPTVPTKPMFFHHTKGKSMQIISSGREVNRREGLTRRMWDHKGNGICFGNRPIDLNEKIYIRIIRMYEGRWSYAASLGFTSHDPARLNARSLPKHACPDLTDRAGFWAAHLPYKSTEASILCCYVTSEGDVKFGMDNNEMEVLLTGVNTDAPLWLIIDIFGKIRDIAFVNK